jgi:small conductance mechanosensitive channel
MLLSRHPSLLSSPMLLVRAAVLIGFLIVPLTFGRLLTAQENPLVKPTLEVIERPAVKAPKQVDVEPTARDDQIEERLMRILVATGWFANPSVRVDEGVVFLAGTAQTVEHRQWADELVRNTQDVVAVVNRLEVAIPPIWDMQPALEGLHGLAREALLLLPFVVLALAVLLVAGFVSWLTTKLSRHLLQQQIQPPLLREVAARLLGATVLIFGVYIVLRVSGLSRLALTVLGGTGLVGLVIGIAFRDITENFLASIFLSAQRPFRVGDLVEIANILGYVQRLTVRTTIVMTLEGNHVQIPNAIVYKSTIRNFTSNPNRREDFSVGIGYAVPISHAQEVALAAVRSHPAVLKEPEPWVLADGLGPATVNLRVYFWLNGTTHSWLKVRSSVIRLVKRSFQENGIEMPDEARELVFPRGVPVHLIDERSSITHKPVSATPPTSVQRAHSSEPLSTDGEGDLTAEADEIENQARQAQLPEAGENLLLAR